MDGRRARFKPDLRCRRWTAAAGSPIWPPGAPTRAPRRGPDTMPKDHADPCIKVCRFDAAGVCLGCHRTKGEVRGWKRLDKAQRAEINRRVRPLMALPPALPPKHRRKLEKKVARLEGKLAALRARLAAP